jgi:hypothetical protein
MFVRGFELRTSVKLKYLGLWDVILANLVRPNTLMASGFGFIALDTTSLTGRAPLTCRIRWAVGLKSG